jgi:hypothetical protein
MARQGRARKTQAKSFTAATYNVLATAYLGKGDYSKVKPELLDPDYRVPALIKHIADLKADILWLQEVEVEVFDALTAKLEWATQRPQRPHPSEHPHHHHAAVGLAGAEERAIARPGRVGLP